MFALSDPMGISFGELDHPKSPFIPYFCSLAQVINASTGSSLALIAVCQATIAWALGPRLTIIPAARSRWARVPPSSGTFRSEEHTSELQSLMRISYAVFCLKKKKTEYTTANKRTTLHSHIKTPYQLQ